jgi:hypothetical protein
MVARVGASRKAALGLLAIVAVVVLLVAAMHVLHGPVTAASLHVSVGDEAGSVFEGGEGCTRTSTDRRWRCYVSDRSGSGAARYLVDVSASSSCWAGELVGGGFEGHMPKRLKGCVTRWQPSLRSLL